MEKYYYEDEMMKDVKEFIEENKKDIDFTLDEDELLEKLYDMMIDADEVTGNGSGSYTMSTWKAEEYICHNWDIIADMLDEEYMSVKSIILGAESLDVMIRCYLLDGVIRGVLDANLEKWL